MLDLVATAAIVKTVAGTADSIAAGWLSNAAWAATPKVLKWIRGRGQPVNHHIQRALRSSCLAATRDLLQNRRAPLGLLDSDMTQWLDCTIDWMKEEQKKLHDELYVPPEPPGGWQTSLILEPTIEQAKVEVDHLHRMLAEMVVAEWEQAKISPVPQAIRFDLKGAEWFEQIGLYFR